MVRRPRPGLSPVLLAGTNDWSAAQPGRHRPPDRGWRARQHTVLFGSGSFRVGERVVVRRNSTEHTVHGHAVDVANGQAGHVVAVGTDGLTVRMDRGGDELVLTDRYLRRGGHLTHAYALTTHRAQGGTWDLAIGVGADGLYREGAYVELSRGAAENWLVLTDPEAAQLHQEAMRELERHDSGLTPPDEEAADTRDELIERVSRSHAKQLAHTLDPDVESVDRLARTVALADLEAHLTVATAAERIATETHGVDGADLADQIARVDQIARQVFVGCQVSPSDRHNVGTVIALDDTAGQATVQFVSADGREATRTFDWGDLRIINPAAGDRSHPARGRPSTASTPSSVNSPPGSSGGRPPCAASAPNPATPPGTPEPSTGPSNGTRSTSAPTAPAGSTSCSATGRPTSPAPPPGTTPSARSPTGAPATNSPTTSRARRTAHPPGGGAPWDTLHARLGLTRTWLAATDRIHTADTIIPSRTELLERRAELDGLLADAPADWRTTIAQLRSGQLSLDDTADLLQAALDGQQARRDWIIRNWPHVVEYQEINRTLTTATWGPDPGLLTDLVASAVSDALADAIEHLDPWLRAALALVADGDTTHSTTRRSSTSNGTPPSEPSTASLRRPRSTSRGGRQESTSQTDTASSTPRSRSATAWICRNCTNVAAVGVAPDAIRHARGPTDRVRCDGRGAAAVLRRLAAVEVVGHRHQPRPPARRRARRQGRVGRDRRGDRGEQPLEGRAQRVGVMPGQVDHPMGREPNVAGRAAPRSTTGWPRRGRPTP